MTTAFHSLKNRDLSLCSPLTLLVLLVILFLYFLTAANKPSYTTNTNVEVLYKNVKTNDGAAEVTIQ